MTDHQASDYLAICRLLYRLAECIDTADTKGFGALFARGSIRAGDRVVAGEEAVASALKHGAVGPKPDTTHAITNVITDIEPDRSSARSRCCVTISHDTPGSPVTTNRYESTFARDHQGWYFVEHSVARF